LRYLCPALLLFGLVTCLHAQVFELNGGVSTLFEAEGGTLSMHGNSSDVSIGAGTVAGRFVGGAKVTREFGRSTVVLGDDTIPFRLPTDVFDGSPFFLTQGAGLRTWLHGTRIFAFAGATSTNFGSPLFEGARAQDPAGILFVEKQVAPRMTFTSDNIVSRRSTSIESFSWEPLNRVRAAVSAGVGANQPYGATSLDITRSRLDVKAAWIEAGSQFRRVAVQTPLMAEPDRGNVLITVRPSSFLSFSGGHQDYLMPIANTANEVRSSVDQLSGNAEVLGAGLTATVFHSTYIHTENNAAAFTAGRDVTSHIHVTGSYLESRAKDQPKTSSFVSTVTEILTPRWAVNQVISTSNGQASVAFGGAFLSNFAQVSANYQTYYVPSRPNQPFEQALIVDLQLHLLRGLTLHGASFVAPDGRLRYTGDMNQVITHETDSRNVQHVTIGSSVVAGEVIDAGGHPVDGAALMLDGLEVYTGSDGRFFLRERKPHMHQFRVMTDQFLNGGNYMVVSAPTSVRSVAEGQEQTVTVVVKRLANTASTKQQPGADDAVEKK
jgi:hypothetical protein